MTDIVYGIQITGEASGAKKAFDETRGAQEKLTGAEKDNARAAAEVERANQRKEASLTRLRLATLAAGVAALAFMRSSVNEAVEAERAQNRLEAVLRSTGGAAGIARAEYGQLADSLAALTEFDDEGIRNAQAELVKFGNIHGQVFTEGLRLSADLAAFMGTSVPQAAQAVGRALQSPTEGMRLLERELGRLTPAEEKHINTLVSQGRAIEAQNAVLEILQGKIGGTAELMNTGLTRATTGVTKAWKDMLEAFARAPAVQEKTESALGFVEQSLKDIREIIEGGDWVEKTLAIAAFAGGWRGFKLSRDPAAAALQAGREDQERFEAGLKPAPRVTLGGDTEAARAAAKLAAERQEQQDVQAAARAAMAQAREDEFGGVDTAVELLRTETEERKKSAEAVRDALDPWNAYARKVEELRGLLNMGVISQREFGDAVALEARKVGDSFVDLADKGAQSFDELKHAIEGWGVDLSRELARGEVSIRSFASLFEELLAMQLNKRLVQPFLSSGTSFIDALLNPEKGTYYDASVSYAAPFHAGRGPGEFGTPRLVHPAWFEKAPRLHGGIGPGEMPAIIRRDESVLTPGQMRAMGGGNVTIKVINETGVPVQGQASAPRVDASGMVVDLVLRRLAVDAGARQQLRGQLSRPEH